MGGGPLPERRSARCALTHRQQRLLPAETAARAGRGGCPERRHTVHDPKIGSVIISSMVTKNWIPAIAQLYCIIPIFGNKNMGGPNVQV